ncbi:MAG: methionyl-tRNA formyltransferase [Acholeplasmatales bacterium]|nr:methionyl-tRNA formyltransferase [Acholeplasmatales bacterium]
MKIVFMGTPNFACPILKALSEKYDVKLVISQPNREKKKGVLLDTPVAGLAKELNLNLIQPESIKDSYGKIKNIGADVLVTAAYGQYVPTKILNLFKFKLNVHGSLLPKHRGGAPIQRCLIEGDLKTGVTIMEMSKGLDTGVMYCKKEYEILDEDNNSTLFDKLSIIGKDLLMDNIDDIVSGKIKGEKQDESLATYSKNIDPSEEKIDLNNKTKDIINKIKGLSMEPGAYLEVSGIKVKIFKASSVDNFDVNAKAGTVLNVKKCIVLKTLDGAISLDLLLVPGKKIMSGKDFSNGNKIFILNNSII